MGKKKLGLVEGIGRTHGLTKRRKQAESLKHPLLDDYIDIRDKLDEAIQFLQDEPIAGVGHLREIVEDLNDRIEDMGGV